MSTKNRKNSNSNERWKLPENIWHFMWQLALCLVQRFLSQDHLWWICTWKSHLCLRKIMSELGCPFFWKIFYFPKSFGKSQCLKVTEKVAFKIASQASYVYILSGQKLIKNAKTSQFWRVFESLKMRLNIVTRHVALHWTKLAENAN